MFGDYSCGGSWYGNVVIRDSVKTDTVRRPDTIAVEPPPQQVDTLGHITIYPMPATGDYVAITGLRPSETDYDLRITDMRGGVILVPCKKKQFNSNCSRQQYSRRVVYGAAQNTRKEHNN